MSYSSAWLLHHKILSAMAGREAGHRLEGAVQLDDAYLGGERTGGKPGRGSENKVPFVAAVSLDPGGRPRYLKLTALSGFASQAIKAWATEHLQPGTLGRSDGLGEYTGTGSRPSSCIMKPRYGQFNPRRKLLTLEQAQTRAAELQALAASAGYGGNAEHKKNPGDFNLTPPSNPRQGKSLCDVAKIFRRGDALKLVQAGLRNGIVSDRMKGNWPKNVWSVTDDGFAMEAQLEDATLGIYHGYTMPETDPFAAKVKARWEQVRRG